MTEITWLGHSTVLIELGGARLLTDPVLRSRVGHLRRIAPRPPPAVLEGLDAVLISHAHHDHLDLPSLARLPQGCPVIAPHGSVALLERRGLSARGIAVGERAQVGGVEVLAAPAVHDGRRHPLSRGRETLAYLLGTDGGVYFVGDTDVFDGMAELAGGIELALLPVWGWGPKVGPGHLDPERAARAAALLSPQVAVPIHWGTLAAPRAPWLGDPAAPARAFAGHVAALAPGVRVELLPPGGSLAL